ncbi:DUF397 domain-containing protein [Streptomyces sp. Je 1-369]|uniref:DUF397 domain-containing protein n=1 Tax=Streptomyces sp. Je 1-369 TaxID=2966192 RepID=UPI002285CDC5|nr:DUF397 domain-containing protein [Streptomyces sp. Je 1-369]WAL96249.1 DUF397 domain-containing protein [Streptomyces sp. Je 1-369]
MRNSIPKYDLSVTVWRKSSHSAGDGGDCLEVADGHPGSPDFIPVRDSKNPEGPNLVFRAATWSTFITNIKHD